MSTISTEDTLEVIEVPPELRGPSDEEILKMSEKIVKEFSGKRKKGERRPAKRLREKLKKEKMQQEAEAMALNFFSAKKESSDNYKINENIFKHFNSEVKQFKSKDIYNYSLSNEDTHHADRLNTGIEKFIQKFNSNEFVTPPSTETAVATAPAQAKAIVRPSLPSSGRVLKASFSFGSSTSEKPKAVIVSAADLAKQRAEERAKKIREALMAKKIAENPSAATTPEGQPAKRPRGRPRKNPIV